MIECVPNFSEGRDAARIQALEDSIGGTRGVQVLHRTSDADHHRTVITFAGRADAVLEAAVRAAGRAAELIDLNQHTGVHPRLGALDVLPFVPLLDTPMQACIDLAHRAGERIWSELRIPVYFYQAAALRPERTKLEDVRRGHFEGLRKEALVDESKRPDIGGPGLHPTAGAVIAGAHKILIAYNINLGSNDLRLAKAIARKIRESNGGMPHVKALGLPLLSRNMTQVSMNLTDYEVTPVHAVFAEVCRLATEHKVEVAESELIGLMPQKALDMAAAYYLKLMDFDGQRVIERLVRPNID